MSLAAAPRDPTEAQLARLARLQGTDPGLFVLAVHAFVEAWLRTRVAFGEYEEDSFYALVDAFLDRRVRELGGWHESLGVFRLLKMAHVRTNKVRHEFAPLAVADAESATAHLARFCRLAGFPRGEALSRIEAWIEAWKERKSPGQLRAESAALQAELARTAAEAREQVARLERYEKAELDVEAAAGKLAAAAARVAELEAKLGEKDEKLDELRRKAFEERMAAKAELAEARARRSEFGEDADRLDRLASLSNYARTRAEYERELVRLTGEQRQVLEQIRLDADFLVKGAAGTGKTLVLLKAIEKAKGGAGAGELDLAELSGSIALLTYTKTLVKYDAYLASLLSLDQGDRISTADSFLLERFHELEPRARVDWNAAADLAPRVPFPPIDAKDLAAEAETFIWGNLVTREEYVDKHIDRTGMARTVPTSLRAEVWDAVESLERLMREAGRWSKHLAAREIVRAAASGDGRLSKVDYVFVDEAQDLSAAQLGALRASARNCAMLAGDGDQSIYQPFISFKRAGIDISGRTRVLRVNFRNTVQLHEFAERYRAKCPGLDGESSPEAFRPGPPPEVLEAADAPGLLELLASRVGLFTRRLGYELDHLCVIAPTNDDLDAVAAALASRGVPVARIKDDAFSFESRGSVRLSTMHSAKGLDFPVVLLYLPKFHAGDSTWDAAAVERQARNLLYVAVTRAMDHVNLFVREGTVNPAVRDLVEAARGESEAARP